VETNSLNFSRGTVRFYRASYKDRWRRTNVVSGLPQRPLASEEVYALHNVVVSEGRNHVGLHGEPYTNTFAGVFGTDTNIWPAGASAAAGATKVEFYLAGTNAPVSEVLHLRHRRQLVQVGVGFAGDERISRPKDSSAMVSRSRADESGGARLRHDLRAGLRAAGLQHSGHVWQSHPEGADQRIQPHVSRGGHYDRPPNPSIEVYK
jgi:hypothetical protein